MNGVIGHAGRIHPAVMLSLLNVEGIKSRLGPKQTPARPLMLGRAKVKRHKKWKGYGRTYF